MHAKQQHGAALHWRRAFHELLLWCECNWPLTDACFRWLTSLSRSGVPLVGERQPGLCDRRQPDINVRSTFRTARRRSFRHAALWQRGTDLVLAGACEASLSTCGSMLILVDPLTRVPSLSPISAQASRPMSRLGLPILTPGAFPSHRGLRRRATWTSTLHSRISSSTLLSVVYGESGVCDAVGEDLTETFGVRRAGNAEVFAQTCPGLCTDLIGTPSNYDQAYFELASIRTYSGAP